MKYYTFQFKNEIEYILFSLSQKFYYCIVIRRQNLAFHVSQTCCLMLQNKLTLKLKGKIQFNFKDGQNMKQLVGYFGSTIKHLRELFIHKVKPKVLNFESPNNISLYLQELDN